MSGKIESGQLCRVRPVTAADDVVSGDIVLCKVRGSQYLHLVKAVRAHGAAKSYQIGNNHGHINGWISGDGIYGKLEEVCDGRNSR